MKTLLWAVIVSLMLCAAQEECEVPVQDPTPSPLPPGASVRV